MPHETSNTPSDASPLLTAIMNLSKFHREHEKYYASAPREQAVVLQRHARAASRSPTAGRRRRRRRAGR